MTLRSIYDRVLYSNSMSCKGQEYSKGERNLASIYNKFVAAIENMDSTVLIPTRLMDIEVEDHPLLPNVLKKSQASNLYDIYKLLKTCRSLVDSTESMEDFQHSFLLLELNSEEEEQNSAPTVSKQKLSVDSGYCSITSSCSDDDDLESSCSCDSEPETAAKPYFVKTTALCVKNLCSILVNLQDMANYISYRYLESIGQEFLL